MSKDSISYDILHDVIKSIIHRRANDIRELCKIIPETKKSKFVVGSDTWEFSTQDQEVSTSTKFRNYAKMDVVWYFAFKEKTINDIFKRDGASPEYVKKVFARRYLIIHEIKTGYYTVNDVYKKYYSGMETQIWIWAWEKEHTIALKNIIPAAEKKIKSGVIKQINLEYLAPYCISELDFMLDMFKIKSNKPAKKITG